MTVPVYPVRKKCHECGVEWEGKAFTAQPSGVPPLPGTCSACIAEDEERVKALTTPIVEPVEPEPPREYDDRHLRIAP